MREAERARRLDILELAYGQHARADDAGRPRHDRDRDRENDVRDGRPQRRGHDEREDEERQPLEDVHHALDDEVGLPPNVAGQEPDDPAQHRGHERRAQAHQQRDTRPVENARVDVAPQVVGAEPVGGAGRRQSGGGVGRDRIVRLELVGEDGSERDRHHDDAARGAERLLAAEGQEPGPHPRAPRLHRGRGHRQGAGAVSCHSAPAGPAPRRACPRRGSRESRPWR